ncbi:hypothetical protein LTR09_004445 [Extremus antarcticus]|uniref:Uncharacterized protein n=1 Tax=Extremus antarcticus TaxID=702011 RepID=A0AAJ0DII0_9PEZI|nr:hypothetical protein LTR09_004445 [Extremus antarcticus]
MAEETHGSYSAIGQAIRYIGGWSQPSGRGIFMFRMMATSFTAAAFTGLGTAYATALFAGPVASIGFVIGSCVGYIASAIFYWRTAMETALIAFDDHPELLHLHLVKNYPNIGFQKLRLGDREGREAFKVG